MSSVSEFYLVKITVYFLSFFFFLNVSRETFTTSLRVYTFEQRKRLQKVFLVRQLKGVVVVVAGG